MSAESSRERYAVAMIEPWRLGRCSKSEDRDTLGQLGATAGRRTKSLKEGTESKG